MALIREHLRTYGVAVAGLATAVLAGVGWASLTAIAPLPNDLGWLWWPFVAAGLAALVGALLLTRQFFAAQRRIVITPSQVQRKSGKDAENDLTDAERKDVLKVLDAHAREDVAESIGAVELRALRLGRIARKLATKAANLSEADSKGIKARATAAQGEADRLDARVAVAFMRAAIGLLEDRSSRVFKGGRALGFAVMVVFGISTMLFIGEFSQGERDLVKLRADCATAEKDGSTGFCDPFAPEPSSHASAEPTSDPSADTGIIDRLRDCNAATTTAVPGDLLERAIAACAGLPPNQEDTGSVSEN